MTLNKNDVWRYGKFEKEVLDKVMRGENVFVNMPRGLGRVRQNILQRIKELGIRMEEVNFNNDEKVTCNDPNIKGEKIVQLALNKEQRQALLDALIVLSQKRYECLLPIIEQLKKHVKEEDPECYDMLCFKALVMKKGLE